MRMETSLPQLERPQIPMLNDDVLSKYGDKDVDSAERN